MAHPEPTTLSFARYSSTPGAVTFANRVSITGDVAAHDHDFIEIAVIAGGTGTHRGFAGAVPLSRGDVLLIRPGTWHAYEGCRRLVVGNCGLASSAAATHLGWSMADPVVQRLVWAGPWRRCGTGVAKQRLAEGACRVVMRRLADLEASAERGDPLRVLATFCLLLAALRDAWPADDAPAPRRTPLVVERAIERLLDDLAREWTLDDLATAAGVEKSHLSRLFRRAIGEPPMAFLNRHRIERAATLLLADDRPVGEIGAAVGLFDQNYFARRFRQAYGLPPTAFRQQWSGGEPCIRHESAP